MTCPPCASISIPTPLPGLQGLEDQLLALVVEHERPDLQEQAASLVRQLNEYNITLRELENSLLLRLANAQVGG
jgi:dynein heavy chain